jgi:hypothetical protein
MAKNPDFDAVLREMTELHDSKNNDYADDGNPYSNFEGSARSSGVDVDTVFMVMIGIKVERLRQLTSGTVPNHESIADTRMDLANYVVIWEAYTRSTQIELPSGILGRSYD